MCRIKQKNQNDQSKRKSSQIKSNELLITLEVTLMINRLINELKLFKLSESIVSKSGLVKSSRLFESLVNSVNIHITRKILNSDIIDHIFCNRSLFIFYTPKISTCETNTKKKFRSDDFESIQIIILDDQDKVRDVILIEV